MLPPIIIEHIKKREEEERRRQQQPFVQLPVPRPLPPIPRHDEDEEPGRGVVIIDIA
jgi:hypothetical protein